jgi:hypothetical protein
MISLHDHHLREFLASADARTIRLITAYPGSNGPDKAEAVFDGVEAFLIDGDTLGTIIGAVDEVDPLELYARHAELMRRSYRKNGGHAPWVASNEAVTAFLRAHSIRGYQLTSAIGAGLAVWARSLSARWVPDGAA